MKCAPPLSEGSSHYGGCECSSSKRDAIYSCSISLSRGRESGKIYSNSCKVLLAWYCSCCSCGRYLPASCNGVLAQLEVNVDCISIGYRGRTVVSCLHEALGDVLSPHTAHRLRGNIPRLGAEVRRRAGVRVVKNTISLTA